ncbi:Cys-tRNA(Pro)/Cys-tRNA(Cys) deacylase [Frigoribacterium sp. PvP120]|uniref:Cys-tRNA(Pro) deacylase n=1 Tax=unclassified Frigoribacterium TaxID=2627005 RepID=UPI001AE5234E|nr:Cys-tRNA(Pro) deacylase [Frigoribacterium sp. PvP121]MBP1241431.1 Cys-tRNA(Pro)/Cys-tRNA(Cys) deacylase [Frigoribacterium sp. PvP121]
MTRRPAGGAGGPGTPATVALLAAGVPFTAHTYEHHDTATNFGEEAAAELGLSEERVFKTLVADAQGTLVVAVVPVSRRLDLKALAAAVGARKASLADPAVAERRTGYVVGGISPVGQRTALATVVDASAASFETVFVSGGRRGFDIEIAPADLVRATGAQLLPVARD